MKLEHILETIQLEPGYLSFKQRLLKFQQDLVGQEHVIDVGPITQYKLDWVQYGVHLTMNSYSVVVLTSDRGVAVIVIKDMNSMIRDKYVMADKTPLVVIDMKCVSGGTQDEFDKLVEFYKHVKPVSSNLPHPNIIGSDGSFINVKHNCSLDDYATGRQHSFDNAIKHL